MDAISAIRSARLLPVLEIGDPENSEPLGEALLAGGLPLAEVTFRTSSALESLRRMAAMPGLVAGAGTVINPGQARAAIDVGARFLVSPGCFPKVIEAAADAGVPIFPGVATPTEIGVALEHGQTALKYFPAEALGGVAALSAVGAPFPAASFIPTGGINPGNLAAYLALPRVIACGGSWMAGRALIEGRNFEKIRELTAAAVALVGRIISTKS